MSARVVAAARSWIGTPYVHQASVRGGGCDCLGLVRGVWRDVLGDEPEAVPAYSPDWSETSQEEMLWAASARHLLRKDVKAAAEGDVVLFRMRDNAVAKHLGIQVTTGAEARFVHAFAGHGVLESPLSKPWERRVVARFAYPDTDRPMKEISA